MKAKLQRVHYSIYLLAMTVVGILGVLDLWLVHSLLEQASAFLQAMFLFLGAGFILTCLAFVHYLHRRHERLVKSNNTLESQKRALEELNRAKSEFLSMMSHEFRTPLNAIMGFAEVLESQTQGELNTKQIRYVGNIRKGGDYLLNLINNILDLSRIELGKLTLRWGQIDLNAVLQEVTHFLQEAALGREIELRYEPKTDLPALHADAIRLRQVLYNVIHNAIKFTSAGGSVVIKTNTTPRQVYIQVSDTGIGIAPEDHEKIFAMFQQVDSSHTRNQQGTGLGLALSRQLVELHGGTIDLMSEVGKGSTFTIRFPRFAKKQLAGETPEQPSQRLAS